MGEFRCQVKTDSASGSELKLLQQPKVALSHWRVRDTRLHEHFIFFFSADFSNFGVAAAAAAAAGSRSQSPHQGVASPSHRQRVWLRSGKKREKKKKTPACAAAPQSLCENAELLHSSACRSAPRRNRKGMKKTKKSGVFSSDRKNKSMRTSSGKFQSIRPRRTDRSED